MRSRSRAPRDGRAAVGLDRRRRRLGPRIAARPAAPAGVRVGGLRVGRSVPRLGSRGRDELPAPRCRDARDVRPRPATGTGASAPGDPDRLHHGQRRSDRSGRASSRAGPSSASSSPSARRRCSTRSRPRSAGRQGDDRRRGAPHRCLYSGRPTFRSIEGVHVPGVQSIVYVVDDDVSVRESLELLIRREGWRPQLFASAQAFLAHPRAIVPSCLVLDVSLPGLDGLQLQQQLVDTSDDPDRLHHRSWRRAHDGPGDEGRGSRVPHEAVQGRCAAGRRARRDRAQSSRPRSATRSSGR